MRLDSFRRKMLVASLITLVLGATTAYSQDIRTLGRQVEQLRREMNALKMEFNSLKASMKRERRAPVSRKTDLMRPTRKAKPPTSAQIETAKTEVCSALDEYEKKLRNDARIADSDEMLGKMNKAFSELESVLSKYKRFKVIAKVKQLSGELIWDIGGARSMQDSVVGDAEFKRALAKHLTKLKEITKECD